MTGVFNLGLGVLYFRPHPKWDGYITCSFFLLSSYYKITIGRVKLARGTPTCSWLSCQLVSNLKDKISSNQVMKYFLKDVMIVEINDIITVHACTCTCSAVADNDLLCCMKLSAAVCDEL